MIVGRREDLSGIIYTVLGIIAAALVGYVFKLKKDNKSKDNFINTIASRLTGIAKGNAEDEMLDSASHNMELTRERIEFMRALKDAENVMDGADEVIRADGENERREPSAEIAEGLGDLTSDPSDAPSILNKKEEELSDAVRELASEQAERFKEKFDK